MSSSYTSLLGLILPTTGELGGTWGDAVNNSLTSLLDTAVAGTTTISTDGDVTLTTTTGAANTARQAVLLCSGARTAIRTITAPAQSKVYVVINSTTGGYSVKLVGTGPTTGVSIGSGESAVIAWNGSDFIKIGNYNGGGVFTSLTDTALTSGRVTYATTGGLLTDSSNLTFDGTTLSTNTLNLTTALGIAYGGTNSTATPTAGGVSYGTGTAIAYSTAGTSGQPLLSNGSSAPSFGTLGVAWGGTGQTTYTDGQLLIGNSTGNTLTKATLTAGTGITITNGSGAITIAATGGGGSGTVTSVAQTFTGGLISVSGSPVTTSGTLALYSCRNIWRHPIFFWSINLGLVSRIDCKRLDDWWRSWGCAFYHYNRHRSSNCFGS